jgi:hypothetical protein
MAAIIHNRTYHAAVRRQQTMRAENTEGQHV